MSLLPVLGLAALLFATTNIDDIFVLVAFFADPALSRRQVVVGQVLGIGALVLASLAGSLLALAAPAQYIGLLGLVPLALGAVKLWQLLRTPRAAAPDADAPPARSGGTAAVALVTIANGGDNIGAYVPVFATRAPAELAAIVVVFFVMTALWCLAAAALVSHPRLGPPLRRLAAPLTPFVLMSVGVLILVESGAYRLVLP